MGTLNESMSYLISNDNISYNFDKFKSGTYNICYVIGFSGGGKSTISKKLAKKYDAEYVELDNIMWGESNNPVIIEYREKTGDDWKFEEKKNYNEAFVHIEMLIKYIKEQVKNGRRFVIDGLQIAEMYEKSKYKSLFNDGALVIVGTSAFKSYLRRIKRDGILTNIKKPVTILKWYIIWTKLINKMEDDQMIDPEVLREEFDMEKDNNEMNELLDILEEASVLEDNSQDTEDIDFEKEPITRDSVINKKSKIPKELRSEYADELVAYHKWARRSKK